jgi:hypothetical protein
MQLLQGWMPAVEKTVPAELYQSRFSFRLRAGMLTHGIGRRV